MWCKSLVDQWASEKPFCGRAKAALRRRHTLLLATLTGYFVGLFSERQLCFFDKCWVDTHLCKLRSTPVSRVQWVFMACMSDFIEQSTYLTIPSPLPSPLFPSPCHRNPSPQWHRRRGRSTKSSARVGWDSACQGYRRSAGREGDGRRFVARTVSFERRAGTAGSQNRQSKPLTGVTAGDAQKSPTPFLRLEKNR